MPYCLYLFQRVVGKAMLLGATTIVCLLQSPLFHSLLYEGGKDRLTVSLASYFHIMVLDLQAMLDLVCEGLSMQHLKNMLACRFVNIRATYLAA